MTEDVIDQRPDVLDPATITTGIKSVQTSVAEFDKIAAGLAALEKAHPKDVACAVTTPAGLKQAIAGRAAWREPRVAVEKARKAAKAPVLELGRTIDRFAQQLETKLLEGEQHYDQQIKAEEQRREAEKAAKAEAERQRIATINAGIDKIAAHLVDAVGKPSTEIAADIATLKAKAPGAEFQEMLPDAQRVHADTLLKLHDLHAKAVAAEEEAARLKAEREELERLRAAQAERDRQEKERLDREQAAERERIRQERAELAKQQAEARAEQERRDTEAAAARRAADEKARKEREEADRLAAEQRAEERRKLEAEAAEVRRKAEAAAAEHQRRVDAAAKERQAELQRQEAADRAAREAQEKVARAGQQLLDALVMATPYVATHGTEEHAQQCRDAIEAATV